MNKQQIGLKLCMDALGLPFKVDEFDDRLILQKAIYLTQAAGVELGYFYRWYLHGPYCPALANDAYSVVAELDTGTDESEGWSLDTAAKAGLKRVEALVSGSDRGELASYLELLASVQFLIDRQQVAGQDADQITSTLKRFDKSYNRQDVDRALGKLKKHGFLR